jgi:Acyl-CoA thioesterase C-terminal domain/Acyl-CoA thioesterase N-terminal domain
MAGVADASPDSIFRAASFPASSPKGQRQDDGQSFAPTGHARGPWDPRALHGGAPAALMTAAFERMRPGAELRIARLGFEFLRPIPLAPLKLSTRIVRPGRRVQELAGELTAPCGGDGGDGDGAQIVCRASALRVQEVPAGIPASDEQPAGASSAQGAERDAPGAMGTPADGTAVRFSLDGSREPSFAASAMEMRWLDDPWTLGPARVWMRLRHPLLPGEELTPLARLAASADFGNGVSAALPFERFLFINADLSIHLQRPPRGEWIGLQARTLLHGGGTGLAESVLHDVHGPVGRAFQTLVVQPR